MNHDSFEQYLLSLQFFSRVLQQSPDEDFLRSLHDDKLFGYFSGWQCFCKPGKTRPEPEVLASIAALSAAYSASGDQPLEGDALRQLYLELHTDHLALFSGPTPMAPPWESVWREREKLLFGEVTELVANLYADWGITIEHEGHEPGDHLGLELAFTAFLLQTWQETPEKTSASGQTALQSLRYFLEKHVLMWAGDCLNSASEKASTVFYRELCLLCCVMLGSLSEDVKQ